MKKKIKQESSAAANKDNLGNSKGAERKAQGTQGETSYGNGDGSVDGNKSNTEKGNGDEDRNTDGNEDEHHQGRRKAKNSKKPHKS